MKSGFDSWGIQLHTQRFFGKMQLAVHCCSDPECLEGSWRHLKDCYSGLFQNVFVCFSPKSSLIAPSPPNLLACFHTCLQLFPSIVRLLNTLLNIVWAYDITARKQCWLPLWRMLGKWTAMYSWSHVSVTETSVAHKDEPPPLLQSPSRK